MLKILIKKLNSDVKLPKYKTDGSSGMDLMAYIKDPIYIKPKKLGIFRAFLVWFNSYLNPVNLF